MGYAKVDTQILDSSLWLGSDEMKLVFVTALLMARPRRFDEPVRQIAMDSLDETGYEVAPDEYGFVAAAGAAIVARSGVQDPEAGMDGLVRLCLPEPNSRSVEFEGRRMMRVQGGFVVLNMMRFRNYDYTEADRQKRSREKKKEQAAKRAAARLARLARDGHRDNTVTVTQPYTINHGPSTIGNGPLLTPSPSAPEAGGRKKSGKPRPPKPDLYGDPLFVKFWDGFPLKKSKGQAWETWLKMAEPDRNNAAERSADYAAAYEKAEDDRRRYIQQPSSWLNARAYEDDPKAWYLQAGTTQPKFAPPKPVVDKATAIATAEKRVARAKRDIDELDFGRTNSERTGAWNDHLQKRYDEFMEMYRKSLDEAVFALEEAKAGG